MYLFGDRVLLCVTVSSEAFCLQFIYHSREQSPAQAYRLVLFPLGTSLLVHLGLRLYHHHFSRIAGSLPFVWWHSDCRFILAAHRLLGRNVADVPHRHASLPHLCWHHPLFFVHRSASRLLRPPHRLLPFGCRCTTH